MMQAASVVSALSALMVPHLMPGVGGAFRPSCRSDPPVGPRADRQMVRPLSDHLPVRRLRSLVAALFDDLGDGAVRRPELECAGAGRRQDLAAIGLDLRGGRLLIIDGDAPVMQAGAG